MDREAFEVFTTAVQAMDIIFSKLQKWASTMLEGSERDEALFHLNQMATAWHDLTLALADHNGVPLA